MKIPDICKNSVLLSVVIYNQLLAFVLLVLIESDWSFERYGLYSIYMQWLLLGFLFLVCNLRVSLNLQTPVFTVLACVLLFVFVFALVEGGRALIIESFLMGSEYQSTGMYRRFIASFILLLMSLRIIALLSVLERRSQSESLSRIEALQARIRPHFLFNSLNTISELTHSDPEQAEKALDSLALLFRAGLESDKKFHTLENELSLCKRYVELERWRLDTRLTIRWNIVIKQTTNWQVPKLILQPLIENAILHGVTADGSIDISVDARETDSRLSLLIENKVGTQATIKEGNGMAVQNIRERLFVLYDDQQNFSIKQSDDKYSVIMSFPKQAKTEGD